MPPLLVLGFLAYCFWRIVKPKSPLAVIAGPKADHWLTGSTYASPVSCSVVLTLVTSGNYNQLFRDAFRYNLTLVERYGGAVKINALLGVIPHIFAKSEVAHTISAEPAALHIRPSRSAQHTRQRTAHLYRNRHVHYARFTLPPPVKHCNPCHRGNRLIFGLGLISTLGMLSCPSYTKQVL